MNQIGMEIHLKVLGVSWGASSEDVRKAYKRAVKSSHPDVIGDRGHDAMTRIQAAYQALKDGIPHYRKEAAKHPVNKKPARMDRETYHISLSLRREIHKNATVKVGETFGIHIPHHVFAGGRSLNFVFDMAPLRGGDNLVLPKLHLRNGDLTVDTESFTLFPIHSDFKRGWAQTLIYDSSDKAIYGYENVSVSVSCADEATS